MLETSELESLMWNGQGERKKWRGGKRREKGEYSRTGKGVIEKGKG